MKKDIPKVDEERIIVVGSDSGKGHFRVYNDSEKDEKNEICKSVPDTKKLTDVCLIRSFSNGI